MTSLNSWVSYSELQIFWEATFELSEREFELLSMMENGSGDSGHERSNSHVESSNSWALWKMALASLLINVRTLVLRVQTLASSGKWPGDPFFKRSNSPFESSNFWLFWCLAWTLFLEPSFTTLFVLWEEDFAVQSRNRNLHFNEPSFVRTYEYCQHSKPYRTISHV